MTPLKEIGECLISDGENDYFFRPSFMNMASIGSPEDIVTTFHELHNDELRQLLDRATEAYRAVPDWLKKYVARPQFSKPTIYAAMRVLASCCDDDITPLTGELIPGKSGKWAFVYRPGKMNHADMILIARSLIVHGIIGKAKVRQLQRHEGGQASTEFNAFEYINAARNHFGISRKEAEQLTMTEFQMLLSAKYPEQKGFTKSEYESLANDYMAKKAKKLSSEIISSKN